MGRYAQWLAGLLLGMATGGCAIVIPSPSSVQALEVVEARPGGSIGPEPRLPTRWRKFSTEIDRETIRSVRRAETTFHFEITDCRGKRIWIEDLYVSGVPLNKLASMTDPEFDAFFGPLGATPEAFFYLKDTDFIGEPRLCGQFSGGGYTLVKIYNKKFRIK